MLTPEFCFEGPRAQVTLRVFHRAARCRLRRKEFFLQELMQYNIYLIATTLQEINIEFHPQIIFRQRRDFRSLTRERAVH